MNKSILIVICDFLILSLLSMANFETSDTGSSDDAEKTVRMDAEMVSLLKTSLDSEADRRAELDKRIEELSTLSQMRFNEAEKQRNLLKKRETELKQLAQAKLNLEKDKLEIVKKSRALETRVRESEKRNEHLQKNILDATNKIAKSTEERLQLERALSDMKVVDSESRAKLLVIQEELQSSKNLLSSLKKESDQLKEENKLIEAEKVAFSTQLELAKVKAQIYEENLKKSEAQLSLEKIEKEKILESTGAIIASQEELKKNVETLREKTSSEIFTMAKRSFVDIEMHYTMDGLLASSKKIENLRALLVSGSEHDWLVFSAVGTIFEPSFSLGNMPAVLEVFYGLEKTRAESLYVFALDASVLGIKVSKGKLANPSMRQSAEFFEFKECTVLDKSRAYYGQVPYKLDVQNNFIAKLDMGLFTSLFGDFRPSAGGFVFSGTGEFIGLMLNSDHLIMMKNYAVLKELKLGENYIKDDEFLRESSEQYKKKPLRLR